MTEKKIRMATADRPDEQGHTIVGGRPQAPRSMRTDIPRGLEILVKRAAIDANFKSQLLEKRDRIAEELQLPLDPSEKAMLAGIPADHLEKMIRATEVPAAQHNLLAKGTAAAMLALLAQLIFAPVPGRAETTPQINLRPASSRSENDEYSMVKGIRPDFDNDDHLADRGARPDMPAPQIKQEEPVYTDAAPDGIESDEPSAPEFARVVTVQVAGFKLEEAIKLLIENSGVVINVTGIDARLAEYVVESEVNGLPLKMAIETLCLETSSEACEFEIIWKNAPPAVEITFHDNLGVVASDALNIPGHELPLIKPTPQDDSAIIRGIRSDFPEIKPVNIDLDKDGSK
ncbi:MAG TPA: hypothetical protein DCG57_09410 [Candidatus Riflebacteria bacterium]|jgi:hypothetical protein|nr:hypothetical protein [Candidatus Riflebacteria bacterium]